MKILMLNKKFIIDNSEKTKKGGNIYPSDTKTHFKAMQINTGLWFCKIIQWNIIQSKENMDVYIKV